MPQSSVIENIACESGNTESLISIKNLHTHFFTYKGVVKSLNGIDLNINKGEMLGLIGESGSGKSVLARSILRLVKFPGKIVDGDILFQGQNLMNLPEKEMEAIRGNKISLIIPNPRNQLNPLLTVGEQISKVFQNHGRVNNKKEAKEKVIDILKELAMNDPERRYNAYPHELSGGMCQRILIAMAMVTSPELLIADDATSGLDVTVQAKVLDQMVNLIKEKNSSALLITHDLGIVAQMCSTTAIMFAGMIVEYGRVRDVFKNPEHPYTLSLLESVNLDKSVSKNSIIGLTPDLINLPKGCLMCNRCARANDTCKHILPEMQEVKPNHFVRCHNPLGVGKI